MNILITGATRFIGRHLLHHLQHDHHAIKVLSRNGARARHILCATGNLPRRLAKHSIALPCFRFPR